MVRNYVAKIQKYRVLNIGSFYTFEMVKSQYNVDKWAFLLKNSLNKVLKWPRFEFCFSRLKSWFLGFPLYLQFLWICNIIFKFKIMIEKVTKLPKTSRNVCSSVCLKKHGWSEYFYGDHNQFVVIDDWIPFYTD